MFGDNPFLTKKDSLVEAVRQAQEDGATRRLAESMTNELFGVYSRQAVVRENLAAYDAAVEEVYTELKEGTQIDEISKDLAQRYNVKASKQRDMTYDKYDDLSRMKKKAYHKLTNRETGILRAQDKIDDSGYAKVPATDKKPKVKSTEKPLEEKKLADKDYDGDGDVETAKKEVWGSRLRAAKASGKYKGPVDEEQIDEISNEVKKSYLAKTRPLSDAPKTTYGNRTSGTIDSHINRAGDRAADSGKSAAAGRNKKRAIVAHTRKLAKSQLKSQLPEEAELDEAKGTAAVQNLKHRDFKETRHPNKGAVTKAPVPGVSIAEKWEGSKEDKAEDKKLAKKHGMTMKQWEKSDADKKHDAKEKMNEAAYSAKAARAGKDIGKPGKMFSKIAKKAGERYGSEERGKKVAGAILKRIRAKHMKEDALNEAPIIPASKLKPGQSLRDYLNAEKGYTRRDSSSSKTSPQGAPGLKGPSGDAFSKTAMQSTQRWADPGKRDYSASNQGTVKTPASSAPAPEKTASWHAPMARPPQEIANKVADVNTGAPKVAQGPTAPTATATASAPKNKEAGALPKTMAESVQVGENNYRIV